MKRVSDVSFITENPPKAEFAANLQKLLDRKVGVSLIYSGGEFHKYNYEKRFRDAFARFGITEQVSAELMPDLDHVTTGIAAQAVLIDRIVQWAKGFEKFPAGTGK